MRARPVRRRKQPNRHGLLGSVDRQLFELLRQVRTEFAAARKVPAYIVFGDETLRDLARYRPLEIGNLALIKGIGAQKLQDFGSRIVETIRDYCDKQQVSTNVDQLNRVASNESLLPVIKPTHEPPTNSSSLVAFKHFESGASLDSVASQLGRARSTVVGYLCDYLRCNKIVDPSPWVDAATTQRIVANLHLMEERRYKPLFDSFAGEIPYDVLRIVVTCFENSLPATDDVASASAH